MNVPFSNHPRGSRCPEPPDAGRLPPPQLAPVGGGRTGRCPAAAGLSPRGEAGGCSAGEAGGVRAGLEVPALSSSTPASPHTFCVGLARGGRRRGGSNVPVEAAPPRRGLGRASSGAFLARGEVGPGERRSGRARGPLPAQRRGAAGRSRRPWAPSPRRWAGGGAPW